MRRGLGAYRPFVSSQPYRHCHSVGGRETAPIPTSPAEPSRTLSEGDLTLLDLIHRDLLESAHELSES